MSKKIMSDAQKEEAENLMRSGMADLAGLVGEAVRVLKDGMKSEDAAHALKCATAVLTHAAHLEAFKDGSYALHNTLSDALRI